MIVIVGSPAWRPAPPAPAGRACSIALAAAGRGVPVEIVGRVGEDPAGEALLLALSLRGVGHAAVLRDPTRPTPVIEVAPSAPDDPDASPFADPAAPDESAALRSIPPDGPRLDAADVELAVRYLAPSGVMVVTDEVPPEIVAAAAAASAYAQLRLVVLLAADRAAPGFVPAGLPDDATVLAAPDEDDGAFSALVGAYAAALDAGADPASAFESAQGAIGWELAAPG